jgi:diguanylate cyclase
METVLYADKCVELLRFRRTRMKFAVENMTVSERDERSQVLIDRLLMIINTQTEIAKLGLDLPGVMSLVAQRAQELTRADGAVVELAEGEDMVYDAVSGIAQGQLGLRLKRSGSLSGLCVDAGKPLRCDNAETDSRVDREACRRVGLLSMLCVPLLHVDTVVGVLKVVSRSADAFRDADNVVLKLMSELIASSMYHATQYQESELFLRATHDTLTGLANRALFYDRLRQCIAQAGRSGQRVGVLLIDMDGLNQVTDQRGQRVVDAAIAELGRRISSVLRQSDTAARLGGDEFGVILSRVNDRGGPVKFAERVFERLDKPFLFEGHRVPLAASVGYSIFPDDGEEMETLVAKAEELRNSEKTSKQAVLIEPVAAPNRPHASQ